MTWVIAQPTIFGQVIMLSDIQVTITDNKGNTRYKDCLRKMHLMDRNIVTGFSGNVIGGFGLLDTLSKIIKLNKQSDDHVHEPEVLFDIWSKIASRHYKKLKIEYRKGGISFLLGGISFKNDIGLPGCGKPSVAVLRAPDFKPTYIKMGAWGSIGSGSASRQYIKMLEKNTGDPYHPAMQMETAFSGGFAQSLAISISYDAQKGIPVGGVSKHFHVCILSRKGASGGNSDHKEYPPTGEVIDIKMPEITNSLSEFLQLFPLKNKNKTIAVCNLEG